MKAKLTNWERMQRRAVKIIKAFIIKTSRFEVKRAGSFPLLVRSQKQEGVHVCEYVYIRESCKKPGRLLQYKAGFTTLRSTECLGVVKRKPHIACL